MKKSATLALLATAAVAVPVTAIVGHTVFTGSDTATAARSTATAVPNTPAATTNAQPSAKVFGPVTASRTVVGPSANMDWGPVQVTIVVKGTTVTDLSATAPTERARSAYINQQAVPMLRQEVLQAKTVANIKNIYGISGATMTSEAFYQSLLAALQSAHLL